MRFERLITTVDSHTEGMATRVITGGIPNLPGKTMAEKRDFVKQNLDYLRTAVLNEPRGGQVYGCIMTPPVTDDAAFGAIWMRRGEAAVYSDMCGHATMGVATTAVEMGMVEPVEPVTEMTIDVPAGIVRAKVNVENGKAKSVSIQNVPSFHYQTSTIKVPGLGELNVDVAFGGNTIAIVEAKDIGIETTIAGITRARDLIVQIIESINEQVEIQDPEKGPTKMAKTGIVISDKPTNPKANTKNIAVTKELFFDRSPCGTGTSGKMATLYAKGELDLGQTFVAESIIGSLFYGKLIKEVDVGGIKAVVPEVTGRVFITGMHQFTIDADDPFKYGFVL